MYEGPIQIERTQEVEVVSEPTEADLVQIPWPLVWFGPLCLLVVGSAISLVFMLAVAWIGVPRFLSNMKLFHPFAWMTMPALLGGVFGGLLAARYCDEKRDFSLSKPASISLPILAFSPLAFGLSGIYLLDIEPVVGGLLGNLGTLFLLACTAVVFRTQRVNPRTVGVAVLGSGLGLMCGLLSLALSVVFIPFTAESVPMQWWLAKPAWLVFYMPFCAILGLVIALIENSVYKRTTPAQRATKSNRLPLSLVLPHRIAETVWTLWRHLLLWKGDSIPSQKRPYKVTMSLPCRIWVDPGTTEPVLRWKLSKSREREVRREPAHGSRVDTTPMVLEGAIPWQDWKFAVDIVAVPGDDGEPEMATLEIRDVDDNERLVLPIELPAEMDIRDLPLLDREVLKLEASQAREVMDEFLKQISAMEVKKSPEMARLLDLFAR